MPEPANWRVRQRQRTPLFSAVCRKTATFSQFRSGDWLPTATLRTGDGCRANLSSPFRINYFASVSTPSNTLCLTWGAKLSPLVSTYPLQNTPVAALPARDDRNRELPILTRIYPSVDGGVPPESPQCLASGVAMNTPGRRDNVWHHNTPGDTLPYRSSSHERPRSRHRTSDQRHSGDSRKGLFAAGDETSRSIPWFQNGDFLV